jgi:hypothetical protein
MPCSSLEAITRQSCVAHNANIANSSSIDKTDNGQIVDTYPSVK